jgi:large subunit ribosomal protein L21
MEAIVKISGKQYRVAKGDRVTVDRLATKVGDRVTFDSVLLLSDAGKATVGAPLVDGAAVTATVVAATRGPKLIVYKYKAKKRYRRTQGARAEQTVLEVVSVSGPGGKAKSTRAEAPKDEAETEKPRAKAEAPQGETQAEKPQAKADAPTAETKAKTASAKSKAAAPKAAAPKAAAPKARAATPGKAGGAEAAKPAKDAKDEAKE